MNPTKVLIVDDSAVVRKLIADGLQTEPDIQVVGGAADAFVARDMLLKHEPDVMTLDIEMPRMDGLSFLARVMEHRPMPVIIVSSITQAGSAANVEALRLGAIDVLTKPGGPQSVGELVSQIKTRVRSVKAGAYRVRRAPAASTPAIAPSSRMTSRASGALVAVGASTGGTQAIEALLTRFPKEVPPIVIVQHMPAHFTKAFADRLDKVCAIKVMEAQGEELLQPGTAYIAPGDHHMVVERTGVQLRTALRNDAPVHYQRPAVDVLFHSVAKLQGVARVGVILTGMGQDGADGLLALRKSGAETLAEDEQSCVVFGMPKEAIARGAATSVVTLLQMPAKVLEAVDRVSSRGRLGAA
ncbi:MAG TPA: chemotaxis response regulator protein-glutamate methylesterase [Vicinamibacterales bacterium]|nr:chemotaxis response regulator protein-glutamate methylesterase [Vicinamibacterales bacterium]